MEADFRSILLDNAPIFDAVGPRIFWVKADQGAEFPYIVLHLISVVADLSHNGSAGLEQSRVQVDCRDETFAGVYALQGKVKEALHGYSGANAGTRFNPIIQVAARADSETDGEGTVFRYSLDFEVWHKPAS